jgi:hypothetical protein
MPRDDENWRDDERLHEAEATIADLVKALESANVLLIGLYEGFLHNTEAGCDAWDELDGFKVGEQIDAALAKARQP